MTALILAPDEPDLRKHVVAINQYAQGRSNAGATFILTPGAGVTTVTDANVGPSSFIVAQAANLAAAVEMAAGEFYIAKSDIRAGSFDVHHSIAAPPGAIFQYHVQG